MKAKPSELIAPPLKYAFNHSFPLYIVDLSIRSYIENGLSLRGTNKTFQLFSEYFGNEVPSYSSVRKWVFRVGLFQLNQRIEYRKDRIWILDHSIESGSEKLLAVIGISLEKLEKVGFALKHDDVDLLELMPVEKSNGDIVYEQMTELSKRIGPPVQIVIDGGPDLKKGTDFFLQDYSETVYTSDIAHKMAILLKNVLQYDENWKEFLDAAAMTARMLRQTDLLFAAPPSLRTKARYMNADLMINWANDILSYSNKKDFTLITDSYQLSSPVLGNFKEKLSKVEIFKASALIGQKYIGSTQFLSVLHQAIGDAAYKQYGNEIKGQACTGRFDFAMKLGWVNEFRGELKEFTQFINITDIAKKEVRKNGLSQKTGSIIEGQIKELDGLTAKVKEFKNKVVYAVHEEGRKIPRDVSMLGMSEVLESIFGKYKTFSSKRPIKTMGEMILSVPLWLKKTSPDRLKQALETVSYSAVEDWSKKTFGTSVLSKRIRAFNQ